jgi:hypothetical protein
MTQLLGTRKETRDGRQGLGLPSGTFGQKPSVQDIIRFIYLNQNPARIRSSGEATLTPKTSPILLLGKRPKNPYVSRPRRLF